MKFKDYGGIFVTENRGDDLELSLVSAIDVTKAAHLGSFGDFELGC